MQRDHSESRNFTFKPEISPKSRSLGKRSGSVEDRLLREAKRKKATLALIEKQKLDQEVSK